MQWTTVGDGRESAPEMLRPDWLWLGGTEEGEGDESGEWMFPLHSASQQSAIPQLRLLRLWGSSSRAFAGIMGCRPSLA
jgi:hypothetical protein